MQRKRKLRHLKLDPSVNGYNEKRRGPLWDTTGQVSSEAKNITGLPEKLLLSDYDLNQLSSIVCQVRKQDAMI